MKVKIGIEFEVNSVDGEELSENQAISAASTAAYNFLSFVEVSGVSTDSETVTVHVDGHGECTVAIGEDHD